MDEPPAVPKPKSPWPTLVTLGLLFVFLAWLLLVGHHRHRLEFTVNGRSVHLTSRRPTWHVEVAGQASQWEYRVGHNIAGRSSSRVADKVHDGYPVPEAFRGWGVMETFQRIDLKSGDVRLEFSRQRQAVRTDRDVATGRRPRLAAGRPADRGRRGRTAVSDRLFLYGTLLPELARPPARRWCAH